MVGGIQFGLRYLVLKGKNFSFWPRNRLNDILERQEFRVLQLTKLQKGLGVDSYQLDDQLLYCPQ